MAFTSNLIVGTNAVDSWKENGRSLAARILDTNESSTDVTTIYNDVLLVLRGIAGMVLRREYNTISKNMYRVSSINQPIILLMVMVNIALFRTFISQPCPTHGMAVR